MEREPPPRHPITCEFEGKTYKGTYWVAGKILTVVTGRGGKRKQVGTTEPVDAHRKKPETLKKASG